MQGIDSGDKQQQGSSLESTLLAASLLSDSQKLELIAELHASLINSASDLGAKGTPPVETGEMERALRAADRLYDDPEKWRQLGATGKIYSVPVDLIRKAYERGGRIVYRCSSISLASDCLRDLGHRVHFFNGAKQSDYQDVVASPEWVVVPCFVERAFLGRAKPFVMCQHAAYPTPLESFLVRAYARLDGNRQPKGCEDIFEFTSEQGTVVGSIFDYISVDRDPLYDLHGDTEVGVARFEPPLKNINR